MITKPIIKSIIKFYFMSRKKKAFILLLVFGGVKLWKYLRRGSHPPKQLGQTKTSQDESKIDREFFLRLWEILRKISPTIWNREVGLMAMLSCLLVCRTFMTVWLAKNMGRSLHFLCERDWVKLSNNLLEFVYLTIPASLMNAGLKYFTHTLNISLREKLTLFVHRLYMQNMNYYKANKVGRQTLVNADQLICEDVEKFCFSISDIFSNLLKPSVDFVIFSYKLSSLLGGQGPMGMYSWFAIATFIGSIVLPPYGQLAAKEQQLEGNFRAKHSSLISDSEMIAFVGGEQPEHRNLNKLFHEIKEHQFYSNKRKFISDVITGYVNKYAASSVGFSLVVLPVLLGTQDMGDASSAEIASYFVSSRQIMEGLADSVLRFFEVQKRLGKLSGITARVYKLIKRLENDEKLSLPLDPQNPPVWKRGSHLSFENVSVFKPDGTLLVKNLTFDVPDGRRIMITGENGCGKSSLFRVLRGLWPLAQGTITLPEESQNTFYFLSQANFIPSGTLRQILIYPHLESDMKRLGKTDEDLKQVLEWTQLSDLQLDKVKVSFDTELDWKIALSPGQKQRMAFARLLYHSPKYAVLDECTNGIAPDVEVGLYKRCQQLGITVFSISHKLELKSLHDYELHYNADQEGTYSFFPIVPSTESQSSISSSETTAE